jgi:hypothetical protein
MVPENMVKTLMAGIHGDNSMVMKPNSKQRKESYNQFVGEALTKTSMNF